MQTHQLPLYPLNVVICPNGLLPLKVTEKRYLDMVKACLTNQTSFGIVTTLPKQKKLLDDDFPFTKVGNVVEILQADETDDGSLILKCKAKSRIKVHSFFKEDNELYIGEVTNIANDLRMAIPDDLHFSSKVLNEVLKSVITARTSICEPYELESASWVSNRWTEMLSLPLVQKQRLMELESPIVRLELIQDILERGFHVLNQS